MVKFNKKYSYRDLSSRWKEGIFANIPVIEINNSEIIGSGFGNKGQPYSKVFLEGMIGVVFTKCNLDNCIVPKGNTVGIGCTNKHHKVMSDNQNWIVNKKLIPMAPLKPERLKKLGLSMDPKNISVLNKLEQN